jgi:Ser/Thr protein kinase RdoA (MazF antagonist)
MLTFLDGEQLHKASSSPLQMRRLGMVLAELGLGLAGFQSPVPDTLLLWDLTHVLELRELLAEVDPEWRHLVAAAFDNYEKLRARLADLPAQVIHNDFNPHNILVAKDDPDAVAGIIDFGDMVSAPLVNDLAIALSYVVGKPGGGAQAETFLTGYNGVRKLTPLELLVLPALIRARLAMTVTITEWRAATRPDNRDYILRNHPVALAGLKLLADVPDVALASKFRTALGEN